jgi:hypothetical protein
MSSVDICSFTFYCSARLRYSSEVQTVRTMNLKQCYEELIKVTVITMSGSSSVKTIFSRLSYSLANIMLNVC